MKATYREIDVSLEMAENTPISIQAPEHGAKTVYFDGDVTLIPVENSTKGKACFVPSGELVILQDFDDVIIVPGKADIELPEDDKKPEEDSQKPNPSPQEDQKEYREQLYNKAVELGLNPHPQLGIPRLTELLEDYEKSLLEEAKKKAESEQSGQE